MCWTSVRLPWLLLLLLPVVCQAEERLARYDELVKPSDRLHWAYRPVRSPSVPAVKNRAWPRNPIDAFILARLEAKGWQPSPEAPALALLRRVHLDLTGLPPTPEEQEVFSRDQSPDAYHRVVDQLLAPSGYGERYARHWLDVVRYGDTNGYERDADKPGAWYYRDRVIRSLDADLPFDRFILEQLAGDELPEADTESVLATGFLRLGPWDDEPADPKTDRFDQLDDMVATTSEAFLGLTLACARCHNHKFEALTMHDYYRLVAVFDPLERPRQGRTELDRPAVRPGQRPEVDRQGLQLLALRRADRAAGLVGLGGQWLMRKRADGLQQQLAEVPRGYFMEERGGKEATHLLRRGRADAPGPEVRPGVPVVLSERQPAFLAPDQHTSRRRLSLARWIASKDNPLTARVIVNRVWQWHFGEGLVRTPSDFGTRGAAPTHPELLDWLANWFIEHDWSLKQLHRLIVTSNTYRMSKRSSENLAAVDPENRLLWRFPYCRLDAESIRDSMLQLSGELNRQRFGPGVRPAIPRTALEGHSDPNTVWKPDGEREASRRTVYVHVKRSLMVPMIEALDFCDTTRSTGRRVVTTVAPQALILFNGEFVNSQARRLAERLNREAGPKEEARIERLYRLVLCRPGTLEERQLMRNYLDRQRQQGMKEADAWQQVCRVMFNLNEFVYAD